jgi:branched-chain amino acid aminotransferase
LALDEGIQIEEKQITRDQLYIADEVFITGTAAEIVGARMIDFRAIGDGKVGPLTNLLLNTFLDTVHGKGRRSPEWLDYVEQPEPAG